MTLNKEGKLTHCEWSISSYFECFGGGFQFEGALKTESGLFPIFINMNFV